MRSIRLTDSQVREVQNALDGLLTISCSERFAVEQEELGINHRLTSVSEIDSWARLTELYALKIGKIIR